MAYEPPTEDDSFSWETYKKYYDKGFNDAKNGLDYHELFKPSGHERDTTWEDEMNYWYYSGWSAFED
jgi:hypothetical protein